ncbi:TSPAN16 [Mytilus coruscus]|uniref:TSPAN16 n=1 Tax=Mytilus coruscus TaxID=42192 RepID=A0A6J8EP14_MYTCO|nr:TSPAN16 [Mytilus coruscus]
MDEKFNPTFDKAKSNIRTMLGVINKYPGVEMINPPNVTMSEPLKDMDYEGFVRACGFFLLVFGVYVVALSVLMLVQITAVVLFAGDRTIINKLLYLHFFKSLDESYRGFQYNDSVSIGWNLVMQQFNCCGIYGYTDFKSSHSFSETWGEPFHSFIHLNPINFSMACCNSIEIVSPRDFQGPCRAKDYIHKRGCIEVLWETMDKYQVCFVALVAITCLIQLFQIIAICYNGNGKSNKSSSKKIDQSDSITNNSVAPSQNSLKVGKGTLEYPKEKIWYPEVQKNNYVATQNEAWKTTNRDDSVQNEEKWYDGDRRQPIGKPNKSLEMDF